MKEPDRLLQNPDAKRTSRVLASWVTGGVLSVALLSAVVVLSPGIASPTWWPDHAGGDAVSQSEQAARLNAFLAMNRLPLSAVDSAHVVDAVNSMALAPEERSRAIAAYSAPADAAPPTSVVKADAITQRTAHIPEPSKQMAQLAAAPRLAWITLWDSDVEDGDAVRIESEGYGRTIVLKNKPVTFAIPVPANGTIVIKGVRDGDGGGITVGLASGEARVLLPVMSVDQTIALRVGLPQ